MLGLIPGEHWEHRFNDFLHSLAIAIGPKKQNEMLYIPGLGNCIPSSSGRVGLVIALRALNLPTGARIGVPLYCCPVVFKAIAMAGYTIRFIDIDPKTFCISPEDLSVKRSHVDAVIAVHMFGNLCDMSSILETAKDKPIIEDCAQSLGSKINGRMTGSFGTIAFFSFRSGKYLSVGEGGALYSNDSDIRYRVTQLIAAMAAPKGADEFVHVVKTYIRSILRSRPLYGMVGYQMWNFYNKKVDYTEKTPIILRQIYRADLEIANHRLNIIDSAIKRQRANADFYSRTLKLESGMLCREKPGIFYNRYHYPVKFPSAEHRDFIADYLLRRQVDTIKYLDNVVDVAKKHYGYEGDCSVAEELSKRVLIIPSYYSLKKRDVQRITQCLNAGWEEIKSCDSGAPF